MSDKTQIEYDPQAESLSLGEDLDGDGTPDITLKIRVGVLVRKYGKHLSGAGLIIAALGAAHALGWL